MSECTEFSTNKMNRVQGFVVAIKLSGISFVHAFVREFSLQTKLYTEFSNNSDSISQNVNDSCTKRTIEL